MANFLYRLGRSAFARRRLVTALWVAVLAVVGVAGLTLAQPTANTFSVPGTESQRGLDVLAERFPTLGAAGATARVVIRAPEGETLTSEANVAKVGQLVAALSTAPQVATVADPYQAQAVNTATTMAYIQVAYDVPAVLLSDEARSALEGVAADGRALGLTVEVGGDALTAIPAVGGGEIIGVGVAAVVLVVTLGSLIAAGLPLLMALVGIAIGLAGIGVATNFVTLASFTPTLALMLGLAVAIDYSLFIVSRYRHELALGRDLKDAAGRAIATAGSAVVFAGATVVIALAALTVVGIPLLSQMGLAAAFTVALSVLVALTLLPAMLGFAGGRLKPAKDPESSDAKSGFAGRWAGFLVRHPVPVILVASFALLLVATPALDMRLGLPDDSTAETSTTQRKAYDLLSEGFGPGFNGPLVVVLDASSSADPQAAAARATATVGQLPDVVYVTPALFDQTGTVALFQVIPGSGPSSEATENLVGSIRSGSAALEAETGANVAVTGRTALNIDTSARMRDALVPYLVIVVGLAVVLLAIVFRSIVVPIKAAAGFVLSLVATLGAVVAVFQWGWFAPVLGIETTGPVLSLLPILIIGVVFGLAMDYEVFLVTRMREEHALGLEPKAAVVSGFRHGAKVVTAAAVIMISVFAGFIIAPDPLVKAFGFALAIAVLFDAFVVRMTIVPAVMALAGKAAWWLPRWLDRILPSFDIEGTQVDQSEAPPTIRGGVQVEHP